MTATRSYDVIDWPSGAIVARCHFCQTETRFTREEEEKANADRVTLMCPGCWPTKPYPAEPAKNVKYPLKGHGLGGPIASAVRPEERIRPAKTKTQKGILGNFAARDRDGLPIYLGDIAVLFGVSPAYVEKIYFKNYLVPELLAQVKELKEQLDRSSCSAAS